MAASRSKNTLAAYESSWRAFTRWCVDAGRSDLPALPETVSLFCAWSLDQQHRRLETVKLRLSAISYFHREAGLASPVDADVRGLIAQAARLLREKPAGKAALTPDQLLRISDSLRRQRSARAVRDRAMLVLGFALGWRGSELAALRVSDVAFVAKGLRISQWFSKTDQEGKGRIVGLPRGNRSLTCPVRVLRVWLKLRGDWPGPLFCHISKSGLLLHRGLCCDSVNRTLKEALAEIGRDPADYGSHSLRAGMATAAAENGASEFAIMQRGGWRSIQTVLRYVRPAQAFRSDPLAGVL